MKPINWHRLLRPYTWHLEEEIKELKTTIIQQQRKYDVLVEELVGLKKPKVISQPIDLKRVTTRVVGWDDYRAQQRLQEDKPKTDQKDQEKSDGTQS